MINLNNNKQNKLLIVFFILLLLTSFSPSSSNLEEYTYIHFSTSNLSLDYMRQGVLCSGIYRGKYFCNFYKTKKIPIEKRNAIQRFIKRENIWDLDTAFNNQTTIIGSIPQIFILNNPHKNVYKKITISSCYHSKMDSLIVYLNDLLPKSERRRMNLLNFRVDQSTIFSECK